MRFGTPSGVFRVLSREALEMTCKSLTCVVVMANTVAACEALPPERGQDVAADSAAGRPTTVETVLSSGCPTGDPQRIPRIDVVAQSINLVLSPTMTEVLERHAPGFVARPLTSFDRTVMEDAGFGCDNQPSALLADLNGDGELDLAVLGQTQSDALLAILLSEGEGYRYLEHEKRQLNQSGSEAPDPNYFIYLVEPGRYTTRYEPDDPDLESTAGEKYVLDLAHAAIGWAYLEKAAGILYWRGGRFWSFATAD